MAHVFAGVTRAGAASGAPTGRNPAPAQEARSEPELVAGGLLAGLNGKIAAQFA
jgi:hypothetical protein